MRLRRQGGEIVTIIMIALIALAAVFGGYKLVGVAADKIAEWLPDEVETQVFGTLGDNQGEWSARSDTPQRQRAQEIFEKLKAAPGLRDLPYRIRFSSSTQPNAFAMPGGMIAVTDGLLDLVESEVGLATVVAHEFGHQQARHSLKGMGRSLITAGILMLIVGDVSAILSLALNLAENAHSRDQEHEADDYGLRMVHKVYGTTDGSLEFFTKISKEDQTGGGKALSMLSTHPYTPDRVESLKRLAAELEGQKP